MTDQTLKIKTPAELLAQINGVSEVEQTQEFVDAVNFVMNGIHENITSNKIPLEIATPAMVQLTASYVAACPVKINGAVDDYRRRLVKARNEFLAKKAAVAQAPTKADQ